MKIAKSADLDAVKESGQKLLFPPGVRITVGAAMCGMARGSGQLLQVINDEVKNQGLDANVAVVGCNGQCYAEPIVEVINGKDKYTYGNVKGSDIPGLVKAAKDGKAAEGIELLDTDAFNKNQQKIVSKNAGIIAPGNIEEYIANDGYFALAKALTEMKPADVLDEVMKSGLQGRGGAGFSAGIKWETCSKAPGDKKYIVCNGSEGNPEIGMHKSFLESDPHSVIEGMILAGYAIGANEGYVYINYRYMLGFKRISDALEQVKEAGLLGDNILGSGFSFDIKLKRGAGTYVNGEATALLSSLEGSLGEPRLKPPRMAEKGLFDKPTVVNNLETLANVPFIIQKGAEVFSKIGSESSKGTKIIAFSGNVARPCWVEVPFGMTIQEIVDTWGKGAKEGKKIKAYQIGGPSGGILPGKALDLRLDFESLTGAGSLLGSGGLVIMDEDTDMLDMAKFFADFSAEESCGKCTTCREGTLRLQEILSDIIGGNGTEEHIDLIKRMTAGMAVNAVCEFGKTAAEPILSVIKYFPDEIVGKVE